MRRVWSIDIPHSCRFEGFVHAIGAEDWEMFPENCCHIIVLLFGDTRIELRDLKRYILSRFYVNVFMLYFVEGC